MRAELKLFFAWAGTLGECVIAMDAEEPDLWHNSLPHTCCPPGVQAEGERVLAMDAEEKRALLRLLKLRWADVNSTYMRQPFASDTAGMRRRKEVLEATLSQLERDIRTLQADVVLVLQQG